MTEKSDPIAAPTAPKDAEARPASVYDLAADRADVPIPDPSAEQGGGEAPDPAADDTVGPGRPPQATRWKKGGPSPNPRGRPRKDSSMVPDLKRALEQALATKVPVARGDRKKLMTRVEIGIEHLLNQVAKGDRYARRDVVELAVKLGVDLSASAGRSLDAALAPNHQAILDAYVARCTGTQANDNAPRELAPPDLADDDGDDDVDEASAGAVGKMPPAPAEGDAAIPEPVPEPGKTYPKPFSQMTRLERRAWYPKWFQQHGEAWDKQQLKKQQQAAPSLDQASLGRGRPPPGGYSITTGKRT